MITSGTQCIKRALRAAEGYPMGTPAPLYVLCSCGNRVWVAEDDIVTCACGIAYDPSGYIQFNEEDRNATD